MLRSLQRVSALDGRRVLSTEHFLPRITDRRVEEQGSGGRATNAGLRFAVFGGTGFLGKHMCNQLGTKSNSEMMTAESNPRECRWRTENVTKLTFFWISFEQVKTEPMPMSAIGVTKRSTATSSPCLISGTHVLCTTAQEMSIR